MEFDVQVKLAVYRHFAETGNGPSPEDVANRIGSEVGRVLEAYGDLCAKRVLVLDTDGASIRMASPFSGIPTQHVVKSGGKQYYANCAWDALGVPAALRQPGTVYSRCEESGEPLRLEVGTQGPEPSGWVFHCLVPAAHWWDNIVFT